DEEGASRRGPAGGAIEQRQPGLAFERLDAAAERRLAEMHALGSAREAAFVREGHEMAEALEVHDRSPGSNAPAALKHCQHCIAHTAAAPLTSATASLPTNNGAPMPPLLQNLLTLSLMLGFAGMEYASRRYKATVSATANDTWLEASMFVSLVAVAQPLALL